MEYDPKRDEKEKHEAKMKEVQRGEELRKQKEAAGIEKNIFLDSQFFYFYNIQRMLQRLKKKLTHLLNVCNYKLFEILN